MSGKYIVASLIGSFGIAWVCDYYVSDKKIFGGKLCFSIGIDLHSVVVSAVCNFLFFLQVLCVPQLQTQHGKKRLTRSLMHGLALLVLQLSWILLVTRISLWSLALSLNLAVHWFWINWFTLVMDYVNINDS